MIRELRETDIDKVAEIWLDTNLNAHDFISAEYWKKNFDMVREMFSQAEIYVYEKENKLVGFIGLNGEYIEGIFVHDTVQSQGIGKQLLDLVKSKKETLRLNVYQKNTRAVHFYRREDFEIVCENKDKSTNEKEYEMMWNREKLVQKIGRLN